MSSGAPGEPLVGPLLGATVLVADPPRAASALEAVLGWKRFAAGRIGTSQYVTVRAPGTNRGMIRLLEGEEGPRVTDLREGWASVELVVRDVDTLAHRIARSADFSLRTEPTTFDLSEEGSNVHRAAVAWGPGNLLMAFTMAVTQPRGRTFTPVESDVGRVFSVGLRTADLSAASDLYRQTLGMEVLLELSWLSGQWHRMWNLPDGEAAALCLLKGFGAGTGLGTIEVQSFPASLLHPASPPGIGWVTYQARDFHAARKSAAEVCEVTEADSKSFTMLGAVGERLEVVDSAWA
jgi:catechol 2,3-dioxygenase-like lactoylglutathione lyase family enzyme